MLEIILVIISLFMGLFFITKGSDFVTNSLIPVAEKLGTSYIAVASIIVSIMLSIPEVFVALYSFFMGHEGISLGVIIGSIVCNIGLMTGLSAMIKPLSVDKRVFVRDGIFALIVSIIVLLFGSDLTFDRVEGITLMLLFLPYVLNVWFFEKWRTIKDKKEELFIIKEKLRVFGMKGLSLKPSTVVFLLGFVLLLSGSYFFSYSLIKIAKLSGISDILIGLTLGAIGPSIPNIACALSGTIQNYTKVAITETFGSDLFTLLVTLGLLSALSPISINQKWLFFDIPYMILMHFLMLLFILNGHLNNKNAINRREGALLVLIYIAFLMANMLILR